MISRAPFARTLPELLDEMAEADPTAAAVIWETGSLTYDQLRDGARRVAAVLAAAGAARGSRVGLLLGNRPEWLQSTFGATTLGATVVPFSTWSTRQELRYLLEDSRVEFLVTLERHGERDFAADLVAILEEAASNGPERLRLRRDRVFAVGGNGSGPFAAFERLRDAATALQPLPPGTGPSAADDAYILYTSGSTSRPKAVRLAHFGVIENGFNIGERQGLRAGDRVLVAPPLFWSYGAANALPATFSHRATMVLIERFAARAALETIERHRCTAIYTLPAMTSAMLRDPAFSPTRTASLRTGLTIGSPQDFSVAVQELGVPELCNIYGATETYGNCAVSWHHWPLERRANCQGPPLPGQQMRFVDADSGRVLPPGAAGLVEVRGYVSAGYAGASAELNQDAFTPDGYYRTGDVGRIDEAGDFVFVARNTDMIKRAGINVSPAEVEEILRRFPGVAQSAVVGAADPERGELIVAFVVPAPGTRLSGAELIAHCRSVASSYKAPDRIEVLDALPLTVTGKLQRNELKRAAAAIANNSTGNKHV